MAALLLLLFALRAEHTAWVKTMTVDEVVHIGQGVLLVESADARMQPENGMLTQRLIGWSVQSLAQRAPVPGLPDAFPDGKQWTVARTIIYDSGNDPHRMVFAARQPSILCGLGLCILVWLWSCRLWGRAGGLLSLVLVSMSPDILAHSSLATSDAPFWCFSLWALWWCWKVARVPRPLSVALAGLALGAAVTAKFTGVLLAPVLAALPVLAVFDAGDVNGGRSKAHRFAAAVAALAIVALLAFVVLWTVYGFRFNGAPAPATMDWGRFGNTPDGTLIAWLLGHRVFPESFLWGALYVVQYSQARYSYLAGSIVAYGRLAYFPLALAWKAPVGLILSCLLGLGAGLAALFREKPWKKLVVMSPLLVFSVAFLIAAMTSNLNIGVRHVIPAVLPWFVLLGGLVQAYVHRLWLVIALPLVMAIESLSIHPNHLAFFNLLAGGPSRGYRLLVDSNLDWGQDLDALIEYSRMLPKNEPLYYAYFGTAVPHAHGLRGVSLKSYGSGEEPTGPLSLGPGVYAISATALPNMYGMDAGVVGPWRSELEARYRRLLAGASQGALPAEDAAVLNALLFSRLTQYLRAREPDDNINYSILIYRLDQRDINTILDGPLPP